MTSDNTWYQPRTFSDYSAAEKEADLMAGDTGLPMAVVEDFGLPGQFLVCSQADAESYVQQHDAEIQHYAERPEH